MGQFDDDLPPGPGRVAGLRVLAVAMLLALPVACGNASPSAQTTPDDTQIATLVVPRFNGGSVPVDPASQEEFLPIP